MPGPFVSHKNLRVIGLFAPADRHVSAGFERSVNRVVHDIDERLLNLRRVCAITVFGPGDPHREPRLQADHSPDEFTEVDLFLLWRGKAGKAGVGLHETAERFRTGRDGRSNRCVHHRANRLAAAPAQEQTPNSRRSI